MFGKKKKAKEEVLENEKEEKEEIDLEDKVFSDDEEKVASVKNDIDESNFDIKTPEQKEKEAEEKRELEEEKKEQKKAHSPKAAFNMYKFIVKMIAFALLVTFGIMILIFQDNSTGAIYLVTGIVAAFSALVRVIPLIKTLKTKRAKLVSLIEILAHILVGGYLILAAFILWGEVNSKDFQTGKYNWFNSFNFDAYKYILIALLASRAIIYYFCTIECKEDSDKVKFWLHTIINIVAIVIACIPFTSKEVPLVLAILSFVSALVIGGEAGGGYFRYRKSIAEPKEKKKKDKKAEGKEAPANDSDKEISDIDPNIIPVDDPGNRDSIIS